MDSAIRLIASPSARVIALLSVVTALTAGVAAQSQSAADYVIGAQDVLAIQVFDQPDLGGKYTVETDGTFSFPLVGRVKAGGMTLRAFEAELKRRLSDGYFKNPQVSAAVETYRSQRVFVMGEVRQAGPVPLTGGMTLIEALAHAGSTLPSASGEVTIVRGMSGAQAPTLPGQKPGVDTVRASIRDLESGSLRQNVELRDGDTIFVPRAEEIFVFGEVRNPGSYPIKAGTTVLQALSLAGGVTPNGAMGRIRIARIVDNAKVEVKVKVTDVVRPGDTIIVPERYF